MNENHMLLLILAIGSILIILVGYYFSDARKDKKTVKNKAELVRCCRNCKQWKRNSYERRDYKTCALHNFQALHCGICNDYDQRELNKEEILQNKIGYREQ